MPDESADALEVALEEANRRATLFEERANLLAAEVDRTRERWKWTLLAVVVLAVVGMVMLGVVALNAVDANEGLFFEL